MDWNGIKIRNIWSDRNDLVISFNEGGKKHRRKIPFEWYFIVSYYDYSHNAIFTSLEKDGFIRAERNKDWVKIYCDNNQGKKVSPKNTIISLLNQEGIKHYEADFHPAKRFLADNN